MDWILSDFWYFDIRPEQTGYLSEGGKKIRQEKKLYKQRHKNIVLEQNMKKKKNIQPHEVLTEHHDRWTELYLILDSLISDNAEQL